MKHTDILRLEILELKYIARSTADSPSICCPTYQELASGVQMLFGKTLPGAIRSIFKLHKNHFIRS